MSVQSIMHGGEGGSKRRKGEEDIDHDDNNNIENKGAMSRFKFNPSYSYGGPNLWRQFLIHPHNRYVGIFLSTIFLKYTFFFPLLFLFLSIFYKNSFSNFSISPIYPLLDS